MTIFLKRYDRNDFVRICRVRDKNSFFGYVVKLDGIWVDEAFYEEHYSVLPQQITKNELDDSIDKNAHNRLLEDMGSFQEHPFAGHDHKLPVLAFPCVLKDLRDFLQRSGMNMQLSPDEWESLYDQLSPKQMVSAGRALGKHDIEIAREIDMAKFELTDHALGKLFSGEIELHFESYRKKGRRLRGKSK